MMGPSYCNLDVLIQIFRLSLKVYFVIIDSLKKAKKESKKVWLI